MNERIRALLTSYGRLAVDVSTVRDGDDLYRAGLTSHASVTLMLACEDEFDVEFPQAMMTKSTFASIQSIVAAIESLDATAIAS